MRTVCITLIICSLAALIIASPNPIPVPSVNLTKLAGKWYQIFTSSIFSGKPICYITNFENDNGNWRQYDDFNISQTHWHHFYDVNISQSQNSKWSIGNYKTLKFDWISVDPNYEWILGGAENSNTIRLFSKTANLSSSIIQSQLVLAKNQGFDTTLLTYPNNTNCKLGDEPDEPVYQTIDI